MYVWFYVATTTLEEYDFGYGKFGANIMIFTLDQNVGSARHDPNLAYGNIYIKPKTGQI